MASGGFLATLIALLSALGAFLFGLDIGYIAAIIECPSFKNQVGHLSNWNDPQSSIEGTTMGFIVAAFSLGAVLASFPVCSAYFLDHLGRRPSITLGTAVFLVGCVAQAVSNTMSQFIAGRFIAGFSIGVLSTVVACYQSELAPSSMRGALTSLYQLMITLGILVATWLDYMLVDTDNGWRVAIAVQAIPAGALLIGTLFMPRSPRWLVQNGRSQEALEVLYMLRENDGEANDELQEIEESVQAAKAEGEAQWSDLVTGRLGGMLAVGVALQLLQQLCGMNAFMYFGPVIYKEASLDPLLCQTVVSAFNFLATFPAIFVIDNFGRRPLLMWGAVGMMMSCLAMGSVGFFPGGSAATTTGSDSTEKLGQERSFAVVFMAFLFVINFAYSWGPAVWVYVAEIFPLKHRGRCLGVTTMSNWVGNYAVAQFTPVMLSTMGLSTFFVFAVFCGMCLGLAIWIPETKGVVLERVGELFDAKFGIEGKEDAEDQKIAAQDKTLTAGYGAADVSSSQS
jgi:sugar porter (SP) family MFS transporter